MPVIIPATHKRSSPQRHREHGEKHYFIISVLSVLSVPLWQRGLLVSAKG